MLEDLRKAFHQAVENFRAELSESVDGTGGSEDPPEQPAQMRAELDRLRELLLELEHQHADACEEASTERDALERCLRHGSRAREIGDRETALLAEHHAARHREAERIISRKAALLAEEIAFRRTLLTEGERVWELHASRPSGPETVTPRRSPDP